MDSNGRNRPPAKPRRNHEFALCLHIFEHGRDGASPQYTIGVWDNRLQPPGLRAICHMQPLFQAIQAVAEEIQSSDDRKRESLRSSQWSIVSQLIARLRHRNDQDSNGAADEIAELFTLLHNRTGELEDSQNRLARLGCLLEETASKAHTISDGENGCYSNIVIPESVWARLLALYRVKQEGWQLYRELQMLRELAAITADTLRTVENWLGNAGTREGAMDSLWRLARFVQGLGFELPVENLKWRGQLVRALEEAGIGLGADETIRIRQAGDGYWGPATGPDVKTILQSISPAIASNEVNHEQYSTHD